MAAIGLIAFAMLCVYGLLSLLSATLGKALARAAGLAAAVITILSALWAHHEALTSEDSSPPPHHRQSAQSEH
jgi:hypothetical protein